MSGVADCKRRWAINVQYAVIGDVHGNIEALKSVWSTLESVGLTDRVVLNTGDNVGYGAAPEACVQFLLARPQIVTARGNYDKNVALFPEREAEYRKKWARERPEKYEALRRDSAAISKESRRWLSALPGEVEMFLPGLPLVLTHYSPGSKKGLGTWTTDAQLEEISAETTATIVICGHTHTPFVRSVGGVLWVNPGSLGRSLDGEYHFAVLALDENEKPQAELRQIRK